ncbi:hypothetical protein PMW_63 [Pseudomonas phage phiPMW]|uniref:Uncharacterized protein n=1 Tax=Pseudomonas phage phiPMW TaxID=1815582 RepID=A0A1S5R1D0_9CAUD|nr:hypothetical protein FDG97_gp063 [Pseudomonas phage phiPMW]ANA49188.1 hypothetical protein PMW_63 [Pseudomonas phage phiPMW]
MNIKEFKQWLDKFPDDTTIDVVYHTQGSGYYDQGGNATIATFNPVENDYGWCAHFYYDKYDNTLLLGGINE